MKPGRELDALVAEKVMGWECHQPYFDKYWRVKGAKTDSWSGEFRPSTDISAAWQVFEMLRNEKTAPCLFPIWENKKSFSWGCKVEFWGTRRIEFAMSETAPHAICLAALEAVNETPKA